MTSGSVSATLGMIKVSNVDEFSEKLQTAFDPHPLLEVFRKFIRIREVKRPLGRGGR